MVEPRTAYAVVAGKLRRQILDGTFSPGSRLPLTPSSARHMPWASRRFVRP